MITPESISHGLGLFYLTGAILILAVAIVIYPSLQEREKRRHSRRKSSK